tara:strand:- start:4433 stop:5422 length:990 start_codon:yes stop_codon:yes gene_type:complete
MEPIVSIIILLLFYFLTNKREKPYDIVITWVNLTGDINDYIELKYLLRSLNKHKVNYRNIYIVHREKDGKMFGYPTYLKEDNRLKFISHQSLGCQWEIGRACQIPYLFNKIPGLSKIFFHIEDDQFIMNKRVFDKLLLEYKNKQIKTTLINYSKYEEVLYSKVRYGGEQQWMFGQMNASKFFGMEKYSFDIHNIKLYDRDILDDMERLYPKIWNDSITLINPLPASPFRCNLWSLYSSYMMSVKGWKFLQLENNDDYMEIHTNGYSKKKEDEIKKGLEGINKKLENSKADLLNLQGDGISGEYPKVPLVRKFIIDYLEKIFPDRTQWEK